MSMTRDQLRAARALLHLQQDILANMARVGVATIRRFEGGRDIGHLHLEALERAVVDAGAVLVDGVAGAGVTGGMTGVLLRPSGDLPPETRARIAAGRIFTRNESDDASERSAADSPRDEVDHAPGAPPSDAPGTPRAGGRRGRPKGTTRRPPSNGSAPA